MTRAELVDLAKKSGVEGVHGFSKADLVRVLIKLERKPTKKSPKSSPSPASSKKGAKKIPTAAPAKKEAAKKGSIKSESQRGQVALQRPVALEDVKALNAPTKDRLVLMVRDPHWLHAYWEVTRSTLDRAAAALGAAKHLATPTLRVLEVSSNEVSSKSEAFLQDLSIHGAVHHWYIPIRGPQRNYRVQIGYRVPDGRFFVLAKSNVVRPPSPGSPQAIDPHWTGVAQDIERIWAWSGGNSEQGGGDLKEVLEEKLNRRLDQSETSFTVDPDYEGALQLDLDIEVRIHGKTAKGASVVIQGDRIPINQEGEFHLRMDLPEGKQVLPATVTAADGLKQRTVVLGLERNTKEMETLELSDD